MTMFAVGLRNTPSDLLAMLGIAIALSAYLSGIRLYAIQKISDIPENDPRKEDKKRKIQVKLAWLTLADAPMVFSAFLLGLTILWYPLTRMTPCRWFAPLSIGLFLFAGTVMVVQHVLAWYKTLSELFDHSALNIVLMLFVVAGVIWWFIQFKDLF